MIGDDNLSNGVWRDKENGDRYEEISSLRTYLEEQRKLREDDDFNNLFYTHDFVIQKFQSFLSQLSSNEIFHLIEKLYQFKSKSNEIEKLIEYIEEENDKDKKNLYKDHLNNLTNQLEELKCLFENIRESTEKKDETFVNSFSDIDTQSNGRTESIRSSLTSFVSLGKKFSRKSISDRSSENIKEYSGNNKSSILSHLLLHQISPAVIDVKEKELDLTQSENDDDNDQISEDDDIEKTMQINSDQTSKISHKIRLSNNIVSVMKGPLKVMLDGTMHMVDVVAQNTHVDQSIIRIVQSILNKQIEKDFYLGHLLFPPTYVQITDQWTFLGENSDRGFSSASIWMKNPLGQRVLVKTQDHPICAANEWLAFILGELIGLPVNKVQISIYQNNLVTLHSDVTLDHEKIMTFMDLPRNIRKTLLTNPIMEGMDLFDHIIQNVDRNPRNILITMPKTAQVDEINKLKIHLIDHSSSFGMGKYNAISIIATKFHSQHLSVVKFDPLDKAKKFELYLNKLPTSDRILIKKTLNRFGAITNEQLNILMNEIQQLLSSAQFNRILAVLHRQRDVAKRYSVRWGIYSKRTSTKYNERNQSISDIEQSVTFF